jgi:hypothetical protein
MKIYYMGVRRVAGRLTPKPAAYLDIDSPQRDQACLGALWREGSQQVFDPTICASQVSNLTVAAVSPDLLVTTTMNS